MDVNDVLSYIFKLISNFDLVKPIFRFRNARLTEVFDRDMIDFFGSSSELSYLLTIDQKENCSVSDQIKNIEYHIHHESGKRIRITFVNVPYVLIININKVKK